MFLRREGLAIALALAVALTGCSSASKSGAPHAPNALTVDGITAPIGLDPGDVSFAWHVNDSRRDATQGAYEIVVSRGSQTMWDSGRVQAGVQAFVPYGGGALASDADYQWTVRTWDGAGHASPRSASAAFETGLRDGDWTADWIRRDASTTTEPDQYTYARKEFTLANSPIVRARAYVSGDQQYEMSINGARVGKGQAYNFPDAHYYETLDVTSALHTGANAIGLLYNWQGPTKGHPAGAPGVIAEVRVTHADGRIETLKTDGSWRVRKGAWLNPTQRDLEGDLVDFTEHIDGPNQPMGWDRTGYDASGWAPAAVVGPAGTAPWTHLVSVRTRIVYAPVAAVSLTQLASGSYVADFGSVYAAIPTVTFRRGVRGHVVPMHAGFLLDHCPDASVPQPCVNGAVSTAHGTQHTDMSYSYVQRGGGTETFEPFDYLGFRYLQIDAPGETLAANDVVALVRHAAMPDAPAATFTSSNPTLDAVFQLGAHSALFSAQEQFIDTPTREKGSWLWDGFNESETAMAAFGDQNETRKSLLEFADSQRRYWPNGAVNKIYPTGLGALDINEFTEIYPEWVWEYWTHTGDRALLDRVYPALVNLANYVAHSIDASTGLVTSLPSTSVYYDYPTVTRINVLGANAFRVVADVATALNRPDSEVTQQRTRQNALVNAINAKLTRADGTYVDGLAANGTQVTTAAQETNACALFYQIVPQQNIAAVGRYIAQLGLTAPPRTAAEVIGALARADRIDDIVHVLSDDAHDGWANILAQGGTFTWEVWRPSDVIGDSMSHGWGANVLVEIQRVLLGVTPETPGDASFDVSPAISALDHAAGTVPSLAGDVAVAWQHETGATAYTLQLTVPPNTTATLQIPAARADAVREGPKHVAVSGFANGIAAVRVGAGTYRFVVAR
jgi:alpha-L-rhamnosidase